MSARETAVSLALVIGVAPGALGASDLEPRPLETLPPSPPSTTAQADSRVLRLAWLDVTGVAPGVGGVAQAEAREILEEAGLQLVWRRVSEGEESRPGEIRVILDDRLRVDRMNRRPVLGATPLGLRGHPFVWIHVPSIRATLGMAPRARVRPLELRRRRNLGVALGRVIAHEIVHALAPSVPHGGELMAARLTRLQLTAASLSVHSGVARAVRETLHGGPVAPPPDRGVLAAEAAAEIRECATAPRPRLQ
jgi:hypothetical protein